LNALGKGDIGQESGEVVEKEREGFDDDTWGSCTCDACLCVSVCRCV